MAFTRPPLTEEQRALAADPEHLRVAFGVAGRWARWWPRLHEEFRSAAGYALVIAAAGFRPERAQKGFGGYLACVTRSQCREVITLARPLGYRRGNKDGAPVTVGIATGDAEAVVRPSSDLRSGARPHVKRADLSTTNTV